MKLYFIAVDMSRRRCPTLRMVSYEFRVGSTSFKELNTFLEPGTLSNQLVSYKEVAQNAKNEIKMMIGAT